MSNTSNQKSKNSALKKLITITGIFVCLLSMFSSTRFQSSAYTENANGISNDKFMEYPDIPNSAVQKSSEQIKQNSSKPHYNFLAYYFMVESKRKDNDEPAIKETQSVARRIAMVPKLLFNSFFSQN